MMKVKNIRMKSLCWPAFTYLVLMCAGLLALFVKSVSTPDELCTIITGGLVRGNCSMASVVVFFVMSLVYIYIFVNILQVLCNKKQNFLAWMAWLGLPLLSWGMLLMILALNPSNKVMVSMSNLKSF